MNAFRAFLILIFVVIVVYTVPVVLNHGLGVLFPTFFGDMLKLGWPGQFNLDFFGFLLMSGFWLAWRNNFSAFGLILGVLGVLGGAPLLTAYLLYLSFTTNGDINKMLLGEVRSQG